MSARDLTEVDRPIAETRANIKRQGELVQKLRERGHDADLPQAEGFLKVFEDSLTVLLERRLMVQSSLRRPRASSRPQAA